MKSMFDEPQATTDYLSNYGAFLIHCGGAAMGAPGPTDNRPLHGELPNARFQSANIDAARWTPPVLGTWSGVSICSGRAKAMLHRLEFDEPI